VRVTSPIIPLLSKALPGRSSQGLSDAQLTIHPVINPVVELVNPLTTILGNADITESTAFTFSLINGTGAPIIGDSSSLSVGLWRLDCTFISQITGTLTPQANRIVLYNVATATDWSEIFRCQVISGSFSVERSLVVSLDRPLRFRMYIGQNAPAAVNGLSVCVLASRLL